MDPLSVLRARTSEGELAEEHLPWIVARSPRRLPDVSGSVPGDEKIAQILLGARGGDPLRPLKRPKDLAPDRLGKQYRYRITDLAIAVGLRSREAVVVGECLHAG